MDRVSRKKSILLSLFVSTLVPGLALAGTVFVHPAPLSPSNVKEEAYPESRFGSPPAPTRTGTESSVILAREVAIQEGRYPASLVFDKEQNGDADAPKVTPPGKVQAVLPPEKRLTPERIRTESKFQRSGDPSERAPDPSVAATSELNSMVTGAKGVQEIGLIAGDLGFFPKTIFVTRDIPVRLYVTGASRNTLCIMMDSFQVRKQVRSQKIEEVIFTPSQAGKFRFYCPVNGMEGTLIVRELVSNLVKE